MTAELVRATPGHSQALSLGAMSVQDAWGFAKALAESSILPASYRNNPGSVLWALEYGRGIGLDVVTTIQSVHLIQGRATMSADLMASLTRRAGHRMRVLSSDDRAEVTILRSDDPDFEFRAVWDIEKARTAKLTNKDTWKQYQGQMLRARAISECVRMACPEVLHGCIYTPEEIGANVDADGVPMDAPVQPLRAVNGQQPAPGRDFLHEAYKAGDAATVRRLWQEAKAEGRPAHYLESIAQVGRDLAAGASQVAPGAEAETVDAELVEDDERTTAIDNLRTAALAAGVAPTIEKDFLESYGVDLGHAGLDKIREMTALLQGAA